MEETAKMTAGWKYNKMQMSLRSTVSRQGNFIKPLSHKYYSSDNLHIICQGYGNQGSEAAKFIFDILKGSLQYLLEENKKDQTKQIQKSHFINLIQSCIEQFNKQKINGSCSFCLSCFWGKNKMALLKSKQLQCYLLENTKIIPIQSRIFPFKIKKCESKTQGVIRPGIQFSFGLFKSQIFFSFRQTNNKQKFLLIGTSCVFNHFLQAQILSKLQDGTSNNLINIGEEIINQSKKRWRTIYQEDMSLIISKINS